MGDGAAVDRLALALLLRGWWERSGVQPQKVLWVERHRVAPPLGGVQTVALEDLPRQHSCWELVVCHGLYAAMSLTERSQLVEGLLALAGRFLVLDLPRDKAKEPGPLAEDLEKIVHGGGLALAWSGYGNEANRRLLEAVDRAVPSAGPLRSPLEEFYVAHLAEVGELRPPHRWRACLVSREAGALSGWAEDGAQTEETMRRALWGQATSQILRTAESKEEASRVLMLLAEDFFQLATDALESAAQLPHLRKELERQGSEARELLGRVMAMEASLPHRLTAPWRRWADHLHPASPGHRLLRLSDKAVRIFLDNGPGTLWRRSWLYLRRRGLSGVFGTDDEEARFRRWLALNEPRPEELAHLRVKAAGLAVRPLLSLIMPVHDPEETWLRCAVASVRAQVYDHWELCVADDASTRPYVRQVLEEVSRQDRRIKVVYLPDGRGIAEASNAALALATGDFIGFLDHDDELPPRALLEMAKAVGQHPDADLLYSDECMQEGDGRLSEPFFKPDYSPDLLLSMNYIGHLCMVRHSLLRDLGGLRAAFDGSQDYDLVLRATERARRVVHIPRVLYHWRRVAGSSSGDAQAKPYAYDAAVRALTEAAQRRGWPAEVTLLRPGRYRVQYLLREKPLISIVIPTRDRASLLRRCVASLLRSTYSNVELLIVDNGSTEYEAVAYLQELSRQRACRVLRKDIPFNWSALNNFAAGEAAGEYLLFLNDDVEAVERGWLEEMLGQAQRPGVGAVGAKLLFADGRIQHAGVVVIGGMPAHAFHGMPSARYTYMDLAEVVRNCLAVTGACLLTRRSVFEQVGGFDEELAVAYNDVDYCLKLSQGGLHVVYTPHALLYHHESASRGQQQPQDDVRRFRERWQGFLAWGDPFYNQNLDQGSPDFRVGQAAVTAKGGRERIR